MAESQIVVAVFGDAPRAREAVELLRQAGVEGVDIGLVTSQGEAPAVTGLLEGLGMGAADAARYADAVPPDGALVGVRADERSDRVRETLRRAGAQDVQVERRAASVTDLA
jgi:hypothetical protein